MPQPTFQPTPPLTPQATSPTMQLMLSAPNKTQLPMHDRTLELSLHYFRPTTPRAVSGVGYEMKWR
jgi:hypothetical protein